MSLDTFTFADAFPHRTSQCFQEAAGQRDPDVGQLSGTSSRGDTRNVRYRTRDFVHGVEQDFGGKSAGDGMCVVALIVRIPGVRGDRQLVRARLADQSHHMSRIESAFDELVGQEIEQLGIAGRIPGADVVDRLDDPDSQSGSPRFDSRNCGQNTDCRPT